MWCSIIWQQHWPCHSHSALHKLHSFRTVLQSEIGLLLKTMNRYIYIYTCISIPWLSVMSSTVAAGSENWLMKYMYNSFLVPCRKFWDVVKLACSLALWAPLALLAENHPNTAWMTHGVKTVPLSESSAEKYK